MAVFRVEKTRDFTVMSNHHLRNPRLSLKAKGLMSLMLSLPEDWDYTTKGLAYICQDGIDAISTTLRELEDQGYLTRERVRMSNGRLGTVEYTIHHPYCVISSEKLPRDLVRSQLLKIDSSHIEFVLGELNETTSKVGNTRAYVLSALFNAPTNMDNHYQLEINHDFSQRRRRRKA